MSKTVIIALAGAEKEDLHKAKWAEIPRQDYVEAARFCTAHGMAYDGVALNEGRAQKNESTNVPMHLDSVPGTETNEIS